MTNTTSTLERSFIDTVAEPYLARAKVPSPERIKAWRYRHFIPLLHRLHGPFTGLYSHSCLVDGRKLVWLQGGNPAGEPVLLLHGFGSCKENWLPILPFLASRYRLFIPDLPGWGQSHFSQEALYGFDHQVARLAEWGQLVLPGPVHVVGSSMGGGIAGLLAARHPELIRSVTLMNAAGVSGSALTPFERGLQQGRNSLIAHNLRGVVALLGSTMANRGLPLLMAPLAYRDLVSRRHVNQHMFRQLLQYAPSPDLPSFSAITAPTFILWGERDEVIHVSCGDTYKTLIPHALCRRLNGVGHMPMVETPRLTARLLRRFWRDSRRVESPAPAGSVNRSTITAITCETP